MPNRTFDTAIVRPPPISLSKCVSTNPFKGEVYLDRANEEWAHYVRALRESGVEVIELERLDHYPDSVFIQDTAVVSSRGRALLASFGEPSRRGEEESVAEYLEAKGFEVLRVEPGGTLEGGDVLVTSEGIIFVGISSRTNEIGAFSLKKAFPELKVVKVPVKRAFHLLSLVSYLGDLKLAVCSNSIDPSYLEGFELIAIPEEECYAANLLYLGDRKVLIPSGFPKTEELLRRKGFEPITLRMSEFWKCDGGLTCLSLPIHEI